MNLSATSSTVLSPHLNWFLEDPNCNLVRCCCLDLLIYFSFFPILGFRFHPPRFHSDFDGSDSMKIV
ncbi:uncharacterized protein DS421_8g240920 [Arachis hypogaea]|nr:uncharacterized protein DS421_8g240920 [Arachis hypogaea]